MLKNALFKIIHQKNNTNIKKVDVLMIEKKLREIPMISIPALYQDLNIPGTGFTHSFSQFQKV